MPPISGYLLFSILEATHSVPAKVLESIQKEIEQNPTKNMLPFLISKKLITKEIAESLENLLHFLNKEFPQNENSHTQRQINPCLLATEIKKDILFSRIAVSQGLCSLDQINEAFMVQFQEKGKKKKIGQIMVGKRIISGDRFIKIQKEIEDKISVKDLDTMIFEDKMTKVVSQNGRLALVETSIPKNFGSYNIIQEIARGGMGVVYKAWDDGLQRTVALKVLKQWECPSVEDTQRFQREARLAASLQHPNIVKIHNADIINGVHYFTMDYVEGQVLSLYLKENRLTYRGSLKIIRDVALALDYAHSKNVIHRDVKPGNIILDQNDSPQLTDFGLAKAINTDSVFITQSGKTIGTPAYMSPEQACGENIDARSDIYSLGAILYEMITGQPPFSGDSFGLVISDVISKEPKRPSKINPYLPGDIEVICLKAMAKDKVDRYATAREIAEDIDRYLFGENIKGKLNFGIARVWKNSKTHIHIFIPCLIIMLGAFGIFGWHLQKTLFEYEEQVKWFNMAQKLLAEQNFSLAYQISMQINEKDFKEKIEITFHKLANRFLESANTFIEEYEDKIIQGENRYRELVASAPSELEKYKKQLEQEQIDNYEKFIIVAWENLRNAQILDSSPKIKESLKKIYSINMEIALSYKSKNHVTWFQNCIKKLEK